MTWSAVAYVPYNSSRNCIFALDGILRKRYDEMSGYEWGIYAPTIPPTLAAGTSTGLTGLYNVVYTYARKERDVLVCESNPSPAALSAVSLTNQDLSIITTLTSDDQVNCVRFYRTSAGGASYYYLGDVNYCNLDSSATYVWEEDYVDGVAYQFTLENSDFGSFDTYSWEQFASQYQFDDTQIRITSRADNIYYASGAWSDNPKIANSTADASLGALVETDHNRPPAGGPVFGPTNNGVLFICVGHKLYFCKPQQPEYWPDDYFIDVSIPQYPLIGGCFWNQHPYVFDQRTCYLIAGTGALIELNVSSTATTFRLDYTPYNLSAQTGAQSASGILAVEGQGIFHTGLDGVYVLTPGSDAILSKDQPVTNAIFPLFEATTNGMYGVGDVSKAWLLWYKSSLFFGYPGEGDTYPTNVMVFDTTTNRWSYYKYPTEFVYAITDKFNNRVLAITVDGYVWMLEDRNWVNDNNTSISWEVETKAFILQTRRHFPRWTKYDVNASEADLVQGINLLSGTVVQTHFLTGNRDTRRRLITLGNGNRFSIRLSGDGPVKIYAVESE